MSALTYIDFVLEITPEERKTKIWNVRALADGMQLGQVRWFGRWRKYSFFPCQGMVFEETCLRDIANFCVRRTIDHRENKKMQVSNETKNYT